MSSNYTTLVGVVLEAEKEGRPRHELVLEVCDTPEILLKVGLGPLKVAIKASVVGKVFFDHGMTQGQIERIPSVLENPEAIYRSATHPDSVVVFTHESNLGSPIIIPVARDRQIGRGALVNEIVSMYAKTGPDLRPRWRAAGLLLWETPRR